MTNPPVQHHNTIGERVVGPVTVVAAGFTTLCCLGVSAALSLATSLGATFMTHDSSLRPILVVTLALTTLGSALTFWRHRRTVWPLVLTAAASIWIYTMVFGLSSSASHDTTHDDTDHAQAASSAQHAGLSTGRQALVWVGLAVLIAAQIWDLIRVRAARRAAATMREPA